MSLLPTRGAILCPCTSFGLLPPESVGVDFDGILTRRFRSSSPPSIYLQLRILGLSGYQVQIACALLLRRARSIRSLPQDAIGRSVVDAYSLSVGSKLEFVLWHEHMGVLLHRLLERIHYAYSLRVTEGLHTDRLRKFNGCLTVLYSPVQRRVRRYSICTTTGQ